jgi:hypothetical protein
MLDRDQPQGDHGPQQAVRGPGVGFGLGRHFRAGQGLIAQGREQIQLERGQQGPGGLPLGG